MPKPFTKIALMGRQQAHHIAPTLIALDRYLESLALEVVIEEETATLLTGEHALDLKSIHRHKLSEHADLIIVVGGDGSLLKASRIAIKQNLPVLGINRGRLGFLTDIKPDELDKIKHIVAGDYQEEQRFLLHAGLHDGDKVLSEGDALNDIVLLSGDAPHMLDFEISINQQSVCQQRADGLIVATPTGSTAYALSAGGPILHPTLDAIALVPMFPHTLSSRPIVVTGESKIEITVAKTNPFSPYVSRDGKEPVSLPPGGKLNIHKTDQRLRLIHPTDYDYYRALRAKLGWESQASLPG